MKKRGQKTSGKKLTRKKVLLTRWGARGPEPSFQRLGGVYLSLSTPVGKGRKQTREKALNKKDSETLPVGEKRKTKTLTKA